MIDLNESPRAEDIPTEGLFTHLDAKGIVKTTVESRPGKPAHGIEVLQRLDIYCEECEDAIEPHAFGAHTVTVLGRMKRDYHSTRCPECHEAHKRRLEAREEVDERVGSIGSPGEEVRP